MPCDRGLFQKDVDISWSWFQTTDHDHKKSYFQFLTVLGHILKSTMCNGMKAKSNTQFGTNKYNLFTAYGVGKDHEPL